MKSSHKRTIDRAIGMMPPKGTIEYEKIMEYLSKNPIIDEHAAKKMFEKTKNSLEAQQTSNCGLITEKTLRWFQHEYTYRAVFEGMRTMPLSFNLFEAFFEFRKPEIYYELLEEENYEISFFEFLEYILDSKLDFSSDFITDIFPNDIILNYDINDDQEIYFYNKQKNKFKILGTSLIRRDNEITITLILGKTLDNTVKPIEFGPDGIKNIHPEKASMNKKFNERIKNKLKTEPTLIGNNSEFQKCIYGIRYDIESKNIDFQYLLEEYEDVFSINTDNLDGLFDYNTAKFYSDSIEEVYDKMVRNVAEHLELFEVVKLCLFLPQFINKYEDKLESNDFATEYKSIYNKPTNRRKFNNIYGKTYLNKVLYSLFINNSENDTLEIDDNYFNIQRSGYWKKLSDNHIGENKSGEKIKGKTWVNKTEAYYAKDNSRKLIVKKTQRKFKEKNSGYIYIVRNPLQAINIYKIGLTTLTPAERAKQLSNTSNSDRFHILYSWEVKDCFKAERIIHELFKNERVDLKREFFKLDDMEFCVSEINKIINEINTE